LGWLEMCLRVNADCVLLLGSGALTDTWKETLAALTGLLRGAAETQAVWFEEPGSHRLGFSARDHDVVSVKVFYLADGVDGTATSAGDGELVLDATVRLADHRSHPARGLLAWGKPAMTSVRAWWSCRTQLVAGSAAPPRAGQEICAMTRFDAGYGFRIRPQ
jgi:hypothetical protein